MADDVSVHIYSLSPLHIPPSEPFPPQETCSPHQISSSSTYLLLLFFSFKRELLLPHWGLPVLSPMALKSSLWGTAGAVPHLGRGDTGSLPRTGSGSNRVAMSDGERPGGRLLGLSSALRAIRSVEEESTSKPATELRPASDRPEGNVPRRTQKDLGSLPRPLTVSDLSGTPENGTKMRISFKGTSGSYSEDAALKAYPNCETVPCSEFEDAFKAVELWLTDKAVLPIESSSGGSIHRNYDLLLRHRLHIVGEVQLPVNFCLLALPGVRVEQLRRVLSHPQALALSDVALTKLNVTRENVDDTAGAAQLVASKGLRDTGVIASARAAEIYGLNILAERVQDDVDNITRFLILARDPIIPRTDRPFRTSIVFTLDEGPGVLFKALAVFALRDINLTKIESRPQRKRPLRVVDDSNTGSAKYFDYLFYIDFEASMAESRAQSALGHLQEFATFLRVLGCYPMDIIM